jgi:cell division protein FtsN
MPRDYKHRATRRRKRSKLSPWILVITGLLLGLFIAFLGFLKMQKSQEPPAFFQESLLPPVEETRPDTTAESPAEAIEEVPQAQALPPKPRFDFYTLLPEMEVVVPEEEVAPPPAPVQRPAAATRPAAQRPVPATPAATAAPATSTPETTAPARATTTETWLLQAGSFRNGEQAERFRAQLALLGLQTSIQKVTINNKDTYHRVRVGPFHDTGSLNQARSRLSKQGIESSVIKVR